MTTPNVDATSDQRQSAFMFSGVYFSHFVFLGVLLPFFSGWLALKGFTASSIGLINGVALILRLACGPLVAVLADRQADKRRPLLVVTILFAVCAIMLGFVNAPPLIAIASVGVIWCFGLMIPLTDGMVLRADRNGLLVYGQVRAVGSVSFLLTNIAGGFYLRDHGFNAVATILMIAACGAVAMTMFLPRQIDHGNEANHHQRDQDQRAFWRDAAKLATHRIFLVALFAAGLTQGAHAVYYAYSVLHWTGLGYSPTIIGGLWATGVMAEIVLLAKARPLAHRLGVSKLLALGGGAAMLRWSITALEPTLPVLFFIQMLHALTFGAAYLGAVEFIDRAIPVRFVNTGMVLFSTTGVGALTGLATVIAGYVFETTGAGVAYLLMAALGGAAIVLAFVLQRVWDGQKIMA